jgi:hypothetical protein
MGDDIAQLYNQINFESFNEHTGYSYPWKLITS